MNNSNDVWTGAYIIKMFFQNFRLNFEDIVMSIKITNNNISASKEEKGN